MLDMALQVLSWVATGASLLGKGFVSQLSHKQRMFGFFLLVFTGFYWSWQLYAISQWQMMSLQAIYTVLNAWGFYNCFKETYVERVK